jgi:hypothetical protein
MTNLVYTNIFLITFIIKLCPKCGLRNNKIDYILCNTQNYFSFLRFNKKLK